MLKGHECSFSGNGNIRKSGSSAEIANALQEYGFCLINVEKHALDSISHDAMNAEEERHFGLSSMTKHFMSS
jgi:hypothetical protein